MSKFISNLFIVAIMGLSLTIIPINSTSLNLDFKALKSQEKKPVVSEKKVEALYAVVTSTSQKEVLTNPTSLEFEISADDLKLAFEDFKTNLTIEVLKDGSVYKRLTAKQLNALMVVNADDPSRASISIPARYQDLHLLSGRYQLRIVSHSNNLSTLNNQAFQVMYLDDKVYFPALKETQKRIATLFYPDLDDQVLVPISQPITSDKKAQKIILEKLLVQPVADTGIRTMPSALYTVTSTIKNGVLTFDYERSALNTLSPDETQSLVFKSMIETSMHLPSVKMVEFKIDHQSGEKILGIQDTTSPIIKSEKTHLHYAYINTSSTLFLYPIETDVVDPASIFEDLKKAPSATLKKGALFSTIPSDVELISSNIEEGILTLDLSPSILKAFNGNVHYVNLMLDSLTNTMNSIPGVDGVKITVSGQPISNVGTIKVPEIIFNKPYINPVKY